MKTWDDWSDFEINKAVVCALGLKILSIWTVNPNVFITLGSSEASKKVDYCNNPADMWPIIYNSGMSIQAPDEYFDEWHTSKLGVNISYCHKNPLRAAAIVFLMMNGVNPE